MIDQRPLERAEIIAALRRVATIGDAPIGECFGGIIDRRTAWAAADLLEQDAALSRVEAERDAEVADLHSMHTLCMDIGGCCPECGSQIDELLDAACTFCKGSVVSCWKNDLGNGNKCAAFEWRGAQGVE